MAKQQDPNSLGAMMAAQNELNGINAARLQNSQEEQAFLQQQQAANAVMMQAAQIGASGGLGQQVGAMNPQTQAILAQYGVNAVPIPGKTTTSNKVSQSGGNIRIENKTTTNNDVKVINAGTGGASGDAGNQAKFQTWLSNAFAKQQTDYEVQRRVFARRDRDLEKQSNKMMRELEKTNKGLSEKLSPESWQKTQGNQLKTVLTVLMLTLAPLIVKPIAEGLEKIKEFFTGKDGKVGFSEAITKAMGVDKSKGETIVDGLKNVFSDLKDGLIEYFNLLIEERSEAIKLVVDDENLDWKQKLTGVLQAGFTGLKGAAKTISSDLRKDAKRKLNTGSTGVDLGADAAGAFITGETAGTGIRHNNFNILGQLENSPEATFSASSRVTSLMNSSDGKLHTAEISEAMSLLRQAAHRHGEICLGNEGQAKQFFQSWGISNYWDSFINDNKLIVKKDYTIVSYTELYIPNITDVSPGLGGDPTPPRPQANTRSVLVEKGKENTITDVDITQEEIYIPIVLYFLTKEGFKKVEEIIGGKGFKFDSSADSVVMEKNRQRQEALGNYTATDINQKEYFSITAIQQAADSYEKQRDDVDWGAAGNTLKVVSERIIDPTTDRISQLAKQGIFVFKSRILGENGKYENTEEGRQKFISDLTQIYAKELYDYYKGQGYSDADAREQAAKMAGFLTIQDAHESGYGTNQNSPYFNYGNMITSDNKVPHITGSDHDANGNKIKQWFRTFNSAEEYVRTKINLLKGDGKRNSQYKGSLEAKSLEEFLNLIQRGYDGKGGAGKYAEDVDYVKNIMTSSKDTFPMVENAVREFTLETPQTNESTGSNKYGTYYANIHGHRVYMDKDKIMAGKTPYEAMTAVTRVDEHGIERPISLDAIKNGEGNYNSFKDILNLRLSDSNPELYKTVHDNPPGIHLGFIKKRDMSEQTINIIKRMMNKGLGTMINRNDPYSLEVRVSTHMTGKTFQVFILPSLWTHKIDSDRRPIFTGIIYQSAEEFDPVYDLITMSDRAKDNSCPIGTNPLFYYCAGIRSLPKEMTDALNRLKKIVDTGKFNDKSELVYTYVDEKGRGFTKTANKDDLNLLRDLGLITSSSDSKPLWTGYAEEWRLPQGQISPSVQSGRIYSPETILKSPYLNEVNNSETGKIAEGATTAMIGMATMVDSLLGTDFSKKLFPLTTRLDTFPNTSPDNPNQEQGNGNVVYRAGDNNAIDNSQTVVHIHGSQENEAQRAVGEGK